MTFDLLYKNHSIWTLEHVKTQHWSVLTILTSGQLGDLWPTLNKSIKIDFGACNDTTLISIDHFDRRSTWWPLTYFLKISKLTLEHVMTQRWSVLTILTSCLLGDLWPSVSKCILTRSLYSRVGVAYSLDLCSHRSVNYHGNYVANQRSDPKLGNTRMRNEYPRHRPHVVAYLPCCSIPPMLKG